VLVTGATGNTGQAVVQALARRGVPVRAMVRAEADRGKLPADVEMAVADFDDPASIAAALRGAGRAYLVTPSSERAEAQQRRFADLAVQAGVGHLVVLSQPATPSCDPTCSSRDCWHSPAQSPPTAGSSLRSATPRSARWTSATSPR
jgi:uncharacterized protein YbjT (DUF2867 family)